MKQKLKSLVMVALCAFAGNAFAIDDIIDFIGLYGVKDIEEYNTRIAENPEDYEAYIFRAFDRLVSLFDHENDDWSVINLAGDFGLTVNRQGGVGKHGYFGFAWMALQPLDKLLLKNEDINKAYPVAVPILEAAIADLDAIPKGWTGSVIYHPKENIYATGFDYADLLLTKAILYETLSFLNLMKGYNPPPDAAGSDGVDHKALEKARQLTVTAAKLLDDFAVAEKARIYDPAVPHHFFNLDATAKDAIHGNAQKIADLPYWTSRFDICSGIESCLFTKSEKRNLLYEWRPKIDMTFRNIFEGKLSTEDGTFPQFGVGEYSWNETPVMTTLTDSTVCGTFPGMNKTDLEKYLVLIGFDEHKGYSPAAAPNATVAQYGVVYNLPEGAENNPENPAMFAADLQSEIALLNPTMAGYSFAGWTKDYEIHDGKIPAGAAESLELTARFAQVTPEGEKKQGTPENPWEIGRYNAADVKAWTDGAGKLTIAGTGQMKDFPIIEAPWYWERDSITALEIKSGVTRLGEFAFYNCRGLTSVTIPSDVARIGMRAFLGCPLTRVIAMKETTNPSWPLEEVFGPPSQFKGVILVPNPSVDSYKEAVGWRDYADAIQGMTLVTLPPAVGCRYVVRDLSSGEAEIEPVEAGGTTYALPIGTRVSIDVAPGPGYVVIGDGPYVIDSVEWGMTIDESLLPRVVSEALYQTGTGSDGETYTSEVENSSEGDVENPVKVSAIEGLIDIATSLNTNVTLKVEAKDVASVDPDVAAAVSNELEKVSAGGFDSVAFVDLSIFFDKEAQENCELGTVIKLHIPWQVKAGGIYGVARMHKGVAQVIPQGEANKTEDGEYFTVDVEKGELVLCIGKFSDYAIAEASYLKVGENAYILVEDGVSTIFGSGVATNLPAGFNLNSITNAAVEDGITEIGARFFKKCRKLNAVTLGKGVVSVGTNAFYLCTALEKITVGNAAAVESLPGAVVIRTAFDAEGEPCMIPQIDAPGYEMVLLATENLADPDWQPIDPKEAFADGAPARFFKFVIRPIDIQTTTVTPSEDGTKEN